MKTNEENNAQRLDDRFPHDPFMLLSFINMKLRDEYPDGLLSLCDDMGVDPDTLKNTLGSAGFEYSEQGNRFI